MSFPEVGLGIIPGANGCARATGLVGMTKGKELIMLTPLIRGDEAYVIGLLKWFVKCPECEELNRVAEAARKAMSDARSTGDEPAIVEAKKKFAEAEKAAAQAEFDVIYAKAVEVANKLKEKPACARVPPLRLLSTKPQQRPFCGQGDRDRGVSHFFSIRISEWKDGRDARKAHPFFTNS
jgi:enoyl-CoA hydratase/carnithine racemase